MNVILNRLTNVLDSTHVGVIVWIILTEFETKIKQVNHNFSKIVLPSLQFKCYLLLQKGKEFNCHSLAHGIVVGFEDVFVRLGEVV